MKWTVLMAGALAGGAVWAVRRRARQEAAHRTLWADATDPVARFGQP